MDNTLKDSLKDLIDYLSSNKLTQTLQSLKTELLKSIPSQPSDQLISMIRQLNTEQHSFQRPKKIKKMNEQEANSIMQKLVGRLAANEKVINDQQTNSKIQKLMDQPVFKRLVSNTNVFQNPSEVDNSQLNAVEFHDELDFVVGAQYQASQIHIPINYTLQSMPSKKRDPDDQYPNDDDYGYVAHRFFENQLYKVNAGAIGLLAIQSTMPKEVIQREQPPHSAKNKKLPDTLKHLKPPSDTGFPTSYQGIDYSCMNLKVIYNRQKTGYEQSRQFPIVINDVVAGRFQILQKLGSGAFASAIKVKDLKQPKRITCLKIFSPQKQALDQGFDEIRLLALVKANCDADKNYLLKYHESFYHKEHLFIETELLGQDLLKTYMDTPEFFTVPILKQTAKMLLMGLNQLHKMHIIHCDLKPENILVKSFEPYNIKIVDMGNASFFHDDFHHLYMQSRNYRAPELLLGIPPTGKIDIWSLGCILAELWLKRVIFRGQVPEMLAKMQGILGPWPSWMLDYDKNKQQVDQVRFAHHCTRKLIIQKGQINKQDLYKIPKEHKPIVSHLTIQIPNKQHNNSNGIGIVDVLIPKPSSLAQRIRCQDEEFVKFLECLLTVDPTTRPSAEEALKHKFLQDVKLQL